MGGPCIHAPSPPRGEGWGEGVSPFSPPPVDGSAAPSPGLSPGGRGGRFPLVATLALVLAGATLTGCGFTPVYGTRSAAAVSGEELAQVAIEPIGERQGQMLRNLLIDRFYTDGRPKNPSHRLVIRLATAQEDLGIRRDATATRARLRLVADFELVDSATGNTVYRSFSRAVVSYNLLEAQYATLVAEQDAYERGLTELAEDIRTRIALFFRREP